MSEAYDNASTTERAASMWRRRLALPHTSARLLIIAGAVFGLMAVLNPGQFLTYRNLASMGFQFPELGIFALAIMLSLVTGGIDLSIVSVANLAGIVAALILTRAMQIDSPILLWLCLGSALVAAVATSMLCGLVNGMLISHFAVTPILATLGTMQLFLGISLVVTSGHALADYPQPFQSIGNGTLAGLPIPLLVFLLLACLIQVTLRRTRFGVSLYLIGTNPTAARFSGLPVRRLLRRTYLLTALLAGTAGLVMIARTNSAKADYGSSYLLQAVLVAILGGVNPRGGSGSVAGVVLALLTLQFVSSGLNMLQLNELVGPYINNFTKEFTWGALLLLVMVVNYKFSSL